MYRVFFHYNIRFSCPKGNIQTRSDLVKKNFSFNIFKGYGHLVPLTPTGKTLIFPFAIFGIPLFILLVADLAKTFSLLFNWICRIFANCWRRFRKQLSPSQAKEIKLNGKSALSKKIKFFSFKEFRTVEPH